MVVRIGFLVTLLCFSLNLYAKGFTAQVDRLSVGMGEYIQLVLLLDDSRGNLPDVSGLNKDFTIIKQSQSTSMRVTNGLVSKEVKWSYLLTPKRKGTLTIPSFTSGSLKSRAINIEVGDAPVDQSSSDDVMLEVEVKPLNPYVKGQVIYTQRLYFAHRLLGNASLEKPRLSKGDAEIILLESTNPQQAQRNGRMYWLIERYYAVFPRSTGELAFDPSVFRGSLDDRRQQQRGFNMPMFNVGRRVTAYSSKASINIAEQSPEFTGDSWLPASQFDLAMTWSQPADQVKAGEPVTVTMAVMAQGLQAEVLPEISFDWPDAIKAYPERPEFRTDKSANGVLGLRQEKIVLVANKNGDFTIPAIEIPWWDTVTNKQQVKRIESFVVSVTGAVGGSVQSIPPETPVQPEALSSEGPQDLVADVEQKQQEQSFTELLGDFYTNNKGHLPMVLICLGVLLLLLVFIYRRKSRLKSKAYQQRQVLLSAQAELTKACKANDMQSVVTLLPAWAEAVGIYPATLLGIQQAGDPILKSAVKALSQAKYAPSAEAWKGDGLLSAIQKFDKKEKRENEDESLAALHPLH